MNIIRMYLITFLLMVNVPVMAVSQYRQPNYFYQYLAGFILMLLIGLLLILMRILLKEFIFAKSNLEKRDDLEHYRS